MGTAKLRIRIGQVEFEGEGDPEWLSSELERVLARTEVASEQEDSSDSGKKHEPMAPEPELAEKTLAAFLRETGARDNQTKKFLTTAVWLEGRGKNRLISSEVNDALGENSQKKVGNASQCLTNNIQQGYCERDGTQFYVTQEGRESLISTGQQDLSPPRKKTRSKAKAKPSSSDARSSAKGERKGSSARPGPGVMIDQLISEGFFSEYRTMTTIIEHCRNTFAHTYKSTDFSPTLARAIRSKKLSRRKNSDEQFEYISQ